MSFALCPLLTQGAIEAILLNGSQELKETYLAKMVSGEWTGTMNLTEPQAGSDLAAVRTKAERAGDGSYRISGQKIFITYGDHDLTDNIIHLVLARLPDAPEGVKGISLFVVPKFLLDAAGNPGAANDLSCVSLEHKLGIHASPTAVMSYGDQRRRHRFSRRRRKPRPRIHVRHDEPGPLERRHPGPRHRRAGLSARPRLCQRPHPGPHRGRPDARPQADQLSRRRAPYADVDAGAHRGHAVPCLFCRAFALDLANAAQDEKERARHQARLDFLIPIVKGWCTETACDVASLAVQVHGGMGFIEETGAAQHFRDARITTIYEGTTGIQANDLIGRKMQRDNGAAALAMLGEVREIEKAIGTRNDPRFETMRRALHAAGGAMEQGGKWLLTTGKSNPAAAGAAAVNLLHLFALTISGALLAKSALKAAGQIDAGHANTPFLAEKIAVARFFAGQIMPETGARLAAVLDAGDGALELYPKLA